MPCSLSGILSVKSTQVVRVTAQSVPSPRWERQSRGGQAPYRRLPSPLHHISDQHRAALRRADKASNPNTRRLIARHHRCETASIDVSHGSVQTVSKQLDRLQ
ncbi:hypothetical protein PMIN03_004025 [Paraphaeosphaeria minitans]